MTGRLTVVDEIFLRTHRGMGTPIALQGLWRTDGAMDPALLRAIHERLRVGDLGRRVARPRIYGARRRWQPNISAHPLDLGLPIAEHAILAWADTLGADLDPECGPGWRLSATPIRGGGTIVALTCSHALADARGLIHAIARALAGLTEAPVETDPVTGVSPRSSRDRDQAPARPVPDPRDAEPTRSSLSTSPPTAASDGSSAAPTAEPPQGSPRGGTAVRRPEPVSTKQPACATDSDWADARDQWRTILVGTARALRRGIPHRPPASDPAHATGRAVHSILRTFDATAWDATAAAAGGTPNSLFIYLVANILWANGFPHSTIAASLPVDTRDEPRVDNDLAVTEIAVDRADTPATIRDKARDAYRRRMSSPAGLPEEILQVLPDRWAYALSKGAGERDILCSNIGTLPDSLRSVGTHHCDRVAARAIHPGLTAFPRTQLSGYLSRLADTYTLALVGLTGTDPALRIALDRACTEIGLRPEPW
ncbi:hypothetical protein [Nocardia rhizosphaerae]|uniref:Condensation domain-containing protein n=1 Tax=Nocardia rhizosphaerae TaxID=1691571 RepID=A0ABV8L5M6_9NOCA